MRLPSALSRAMMNHLGNTYFHQIWNAPDDHGRANFPLLKAAERLKTGVIPVGLSVVGLPTTDTVYAVYRVSASVFGRFVSLPHQTWTSDKSVRETNKVQITTYAASGRAVPEGTVRLYYDRVLGTVLVAVDRKYTAGCVGESYPNLYMTVYFDTTRLTPTVTQLFTVSPTNTVASVTAAIEYAKGGYPAGTLLSINGWAYAPNRYPTLKNGDIVQIICDPDIVGYCDLNIDDNVTGYYSSLYKEYREILHIPKALNPANTTITNDTLSLVVFDPNTGKGVFGHQIDQHAVESITHNDFSVGRTALQMFQNVLQSTSVSVRVHVRYPTQIQPLIDETNHLRDLYTLSDSEIKLQLAGLSTNQVPEWRAPNLEKSAFLDLLYNFDHLGETDLVARYSAAVGYYSVASTLSQSMHYYTYKGSEVQITKPARLFGHGCQVIVYANGRKVPQQFIHLTDSGCDVKLGFKAGGYVGQGTRVAVYITEDGPEMPIFYHPTSTTPTITVPHDDYRLVRIHTYMSPKKVIGGTVTKGYELIPVSPGDYQVTVNQNGSATFKASTAHYNENFYLVPVCGLNTQVTPLDQMITNKAPIVVPLLMKDTNGNNLPLVATETIEVYINGYRLIEDVDYECKPVTGEHNDILQQVIVVSNQEYLNLVGTGNVMEVVVHGDRVVSVDKGYAIANQLHREQPPMMWSKTCGRAFVRGLLVERVIESGTTLTSQDSLVDGSPYLLEWSVPYGVRKLMASVNPSPDENLRTRIYRVLKLTPPVYPDLVIISDQYALYSPYLAQIVGDVASGVLTIVDEVKDDAFLRQFDSYKLLIERDVILGNNTQFLDKRFVTLAAHYANLSVTNPQQMVLVQRLISLTLLPAQLAINEVLV